jgi:flagellar hook-basal body complex protein FliE
MAHSLAIVRYGKFSSADAPGHFSGAETAETAETAASRQQSGGNVQTGGIDTSRIEAMIAQLKAAATKPQAIAPTEVSAAKVNFADALKASLDSVSATQQKSAALGRSFTSGDDKVSLSDVMIAAQKSSIAFQATVQVRNKLVTAYNEIMNMQV